MSDDEHSGRGASGAMTGPRASGSPVETAPGGGSTAVPPGGGGSEPPPDGAGSAAVGGAAAKPRASFFRELPFLIIVAFVLALLIKAFLVQAFYIPSGSMEQTLQLQDRVLVNKLVYRFRDVHRGEIVVFNGRDSFTPDPGTLVTPPATGVQKVLRGIGSAVGLSTPGEKDFIKRVIGIGGDRVACCTNGHVTVQVGGKGPYIELHEPYLYQDDHQPFCQAGTAGQCPPGSAGVLVPPGRLWVMGDHRGESSDSRAHRGVDQGTVPVADVIGRAFVIVWPVRRATVLHVPSTFDGPLKAAAGAAAGGTPFALGAVGVLPLAVLRRRRAARA